MRTILSGFAATATPTLVGRSPSRFEPTSADTPGCDTRAEFLQARRAFVVATSDPHRGG